MPRLMQHDGGAPRPRRISPLLSTCAWAALAAVSLHPQSARAQAFQSNGNPSVQSGFATRQVTGPNTETITVETDTAILNWSITPTGSNYVFLPQGNVATFVNGVEQGDYLVINRILSTNGTTPRVDFLGTVRSRLDGEVGGRVWFYAPGGILVGSTAVFDVGSLLLTANDPVEILDEFGYGTGSYRFTAGPGSTASVVNQGTINAGGADAYVAMIAPRVRQLGSVNVNGSAAYIAAERVDLTINGTLFDISVGIGSDADAPGGATLEHNGATITNEPGPDEEPDAPRQVVMVAVPRNNAVTMLVAGNLGYQEASSVSLQGGRIVLSAGYNVAGGNITTRATATTASADIQIENLTANADVVGRATGSAIAQANSLEFAGSLELQAVTEATLRTVFGGEASVAGDLFLTADGSNGTAGTATLEAAIDGTITIGGSAFVTADATASGSAPVGTSAQGGTASVIARNGSSITIEQGLSVSADAFGGFGFTLGGNGTGGNAVVEADGGAIDVNGSATVSARGYGGNGDSGGIGRGGQARVSALGGSVEVGYGLAVVASGFGGNEVGYGEDGDAFGGTATLQAIAVDGNGGTVAAGEEIDVLADGGFVTELEDIGPSANGTGGTVNVTLNGGAISGSQLLAAARGDAGAGQDSFSGEDGGDGYTGTGGDATVTIGGTSDTLPPLTIDVRGLGGDGGVGENGGAGGIGQGGNATLIVEDGSPQLGNFEIDARGLGGTGGVADFAAGDSGDGGAGFGGVVLVEVGSGGTLDLLDSFIDVTGQGGEGGYGSPGGFGSDAGSGGSGGDGTGGTLEIRTTGGIITATGEVGLLLAANGVGGTGGDGGSIFMGGGTAGNGGNGGNGFGGIAFINVQGGSITASDTGLFSNGVSGDGGVGGDDAGSGGANGNPGLGSGGLSRILVTDANGASGEASLGVTIVESQLVNAFGDLAASSGAGRVLIEDLDTVDGGLDFLSLNVSALGTPAEDGPGFELRSTEGPTTTGNAIILVSGDAEIEAEGSGGFQGTGFVFINSNQSILVSHLAPTADARTISGGIISLEATDSITSNAVSLIAATNGNANLLASTVDIGRVSATRDVFVEAQTIGIQSAIAGRDVSLFADGDIDITFAEAGDDFLATTDGDFTAGTINTTGLGEDDSGGDSFAPIKDGPVAAGGPAGSNIQISAVGDIRLDNADAADSIELTSSDGSILSANLLRAGLDITLDAGEDVAINDADAGGFMFLSGEAVSAGDLSAGGSIVVFSDSGDVTLASAASGGTVTVTAVGAADLGTLEAEFDIGVSGDSITIDSATAGRDIDLDSSGAIVVGFAEAGDDFRASTGDTFTGTDIAATGLGQDSEDGYGAADGGNIVIDADGDIRLDTGTAANLIDLESVTGNIFSAGTLTATSLVAEAAFDLALNDVFVTTTLGLNAFDGSITGNSFNSDGGIFLNASEDIVLAEADAGGAVSLLADGDIDTGTIVAGSTIFASSGGSTAIDIADSGASIIVQADGTASLGTLDADIDITVDATGITLADGEAGRDIDLGSSGNINVTFARAGDDFLASAGGTFTGVTVITTGLGEDDTGGGDSLEIKGPAELGGPAGSNIIISANGEVRLDNGDAADRLELSSSGSIRSSTLLRAGAGMLVSAGADIGINDAEAGDEVLLDAVGSASARDLGAGGSVDVVAETDIVLRDVTSETGEIALDSSRGNITARDLSAATGIFAVAFGGDLTLASGQSDAGIDLFADGNLQAGTLDAADFIFASAGGNVGITSATGGESMFVNAGGTASLGTLDLARDLVVDAAAINLASGTAGRDIVLEASGNINVTFAEAGDDFIATAGGSFTGGTVITTGLGEDDTGGDTLDIKGAADAQGQLGSNIQIAATGDIRLDNGDAADLLELDSSGGSILSANQLRAGTDIDLEANGGINVARLTAVDAVTLNAGGDILVSTDLVAGGRIEAVGRSVELNALGPLTVALVSATGGSAELNSGGNLTLQSVTATANVSANSGATLAITGNIGGQQIDLASRDISVGSGAQIGSITGTNRINIVATGITGATVTLGGNAGGTGYRLDNSEFGVFTARNITFRSQVQGGTLRVENLAARGAQGQNPNVTEELSIESANNIEVVGTVGLNNAGNANVLSFVASSEFFADAATADISVTNGNSLSGELSIEADSIVVASQAAANESEALATAAERNDRLGENDGETNEEGYLRANSVVLAASDRIWVQNSGATNQIGDRRGITAGSGGITLLGDGEATVEIIINGRQEDGAGGFTTGRDLIDLVEIDGEFAAGSTINGCLISGVGCSPPEFSETPVIQDVVQELLNEDEEEDEEESDSISRPPLLRLASLIRLLGYPFAPVIDEPVTGTGNEDQWQAPPTELIDTPQTPRNEVIDQPVTGSGNEDRQNQDDPD